MAGVNKVILVGNLGRDPELKYTQSGDAVCRLNVGTTRSWTNKQTSERCEKTEWHRVTVWRKQAESCNACLSKGSQVYIEGRLETTKYQDKNGSDRYSTDVVADNVQFLGGKPSGQGQSNQSDGQQSPQTNGPEDDVGDDIPF